MKQLVVSFSAAVILVAAVAGRANAAVGCKSVTLKAIAVGSTPSEAWDVCKKILEMKTNVQKQRCKKPCKFRDGRLRASAMRKVSALQFGLTCQMTVKCCCYKKWKGKTKTKKVRRK